MKPFLFVINAVPIPDNKECEDIAGAIVHIWVFAKDKEEAKINAIDYIRNYLWEVTNFEYELEIQQEQIAKLHEAELALYNKAFHFGIAAEFLAHSKVPGNPDDAVEIRSLNKPQ
ncbi:hypothetical protein FLT15_00060 [Paenibacillus thiaminolyticus]|uniref:hypothetical protein n=1 Tax=Paenibacillus thiaminolyticus TaxID=49283 RepID=UPI001164E01E|nr:hypothetical protein [Paenibacillus thiaminolyticus]NGP56809.1 hypothetical protein [Paenibacillus thiaminolyticus]